VSRMTTALGWTHALERGTDRREDRGVGSCEPDHRIARTQTHVY